MDKDGENDIFIQVTCCFSSDNLNRRFQYDLNVNQEDTKHPVIESEFLYTEEDTVDKIFNDTIEELNLARLYLDGYDVTIVKNGKRNIFYEQHDGNTTLKTEKSSTASSSSNEDTDDDSSEDCNGLVHNFIRTIFEDLVSIKEVHYIFSVGWTEINELNQLLDLLNGNGLAQCFNLPQLLETISTGLKNKNDMNNHNILSIVLEQQWIDNINGQPMHKVSTVNFCDFRYANEKSMPFPSHQEPTINFYPQPTSYLPPYMLSPPPQLPHTSFFSMPPPPPPMMLPLSPDAMFNFRNNNLFDNANAALVVQQNQTLLKNAEALLSKLTINDMDEERRKEIQDWMYLKSECDNYLSSSTLEIPPPSYFHNNSVLPMQQQLPQQPSSLLPIIEMDENSTGREEEEEEETNEDNDSESGSYIDINDQSNNLFEKISDKIENFQQKTDELVRDKSSEYFENNPKVIFSSGSDCKVKEPQVPALPYDNLLDEAVGGCDNDLTKSYTTSEQYLATGRRRSIRDNNILNSDELDLIRKAAAATSFDMDSVKEGPENEHQTKLDELRKTLKKSIA